MGFFYRIMSKKEFKNENFYTIKGWMLNDMNLSGVELCLYALIYGFTQDMETKYKGTIRYMCEAIGVTRQTIYNNLDSLIKKGFIKREETSYYGRDWSVYSVTDVRKEIRQGVKKLDSESNNLTGSKDFGHEGQKIIQESKKFIHPSNKKERIKEDTKEYMKENKGETSSPALSVLLCLNELTNRNFQLKGENEKLILARIKDGATESEMCKVVRMKVEEWIKNDKMKVQLRPSTLFRKSNYDRYVQDLEVWNPKNDPVKKKEQEKILSETFSNPWA